MKRKVGYHLRKLFCFLVIVVLVLQGVPAFVAGKESSTTDNEVKRVNGEGRAEYMGLKLFKGQLHSHTSLSDGIELPNDAYEFVKQHTDLDFFAVTEHDVTYEISTGSDYITDYKDSYSEDYKTLHEQSNAHNKNDEFVAIPGTEVTWYDKAGHMNLFNTAWFPRTYAKGGGGNAWIEGGNLRYDLPTFYARLTQDPNAIAQFNHPSATRHGNFFDFKHYNKGVDKNITLYEYRFDSNYPNMFNDFVLALDKGWHVSPTYSGDEHSGNWGTRDPYVTGLWTDELSRAGIYDAMRNRRTFTSADRNFEMAFSANDHFMGSILPADTEEININVVLKDPDRKDPIDKVSIYTNEGRIVKEYTDINSNEITIEDTLPSNDGDYFFVRVFQKDGDEAISAPIWIGEETKGTDHAPEIEIDGQIPERVLLDDEVVIPDATAVDDSGETPAVEVTVYDSKGGVEIPKDQFTAEEYGEYFIKYSATDSKGNTRVELRRILVDSENLDAENILNEFNPIVNIGEKNKEVGTNLVTDKVLMEAYVQYKPASGEGWNDAQIVKTDVSYFEAAYGDTIKASNYRILASHEATLSELDAGTVYEYRYGLSEGGPWGEAHTFETVAQSGEKVMYVLGDFEEADQKPKDFDLFNDMLDMLKEKNANGHLMIQLGNLVDHAANIKPWSDVFAHIFNKHNLTTAHLAGELEPYTRKGRLETWKGFFNLPKNGGASLLETNYSFDYGDVHVAVLNTLTDIDEQLVWLEEDMRATSKKWKVVMGHHPYYGGYYSDMPGMDIDRVKLSNKFRQLGVNLYIGGQDHIYKRTTIRDGVKSEDVNRGTTFITAGTTGPQFYENKEFDWDNVVYDEKLQTGIILQADDEGLTVKAYNINGEEIDAFTIQPDMDLTRFDIENNAFRGVGLLNYSKSINSAVVVGEKYDYTGGELLESEIKEVELEHLGLEQMVSFDQPIHFDDEHTIKVSVFDNLTDKNLLFPTTVVKEGMIGDGSPNNPFRIKSVEGLNKMNQFPDKHFVLEKDIVGNADLFTAVGANGAPFTGTFDGNGHTISGLIVSSEGAGIFAKNEGTIKNIGVVDTHINSDHDNIGLLVDLNNGTVENAYSTGSIIGDVTAGGLVGYSNGIVRNSYSAADVTVRRSQAAGVIGITNTGSRTENVYSTGTIKASNYNAGGITAYAYNDTVVKNVIALNPSVTASTSANRVIGQVAPNHKAIFENNYAFADMFVDKEGEKEESPTTKKGMGLSQAEVESLDTYKERLGWDFESVWTWDENEKRPVLQVFADSVPDIFVSSIKHLVEQYEAEGHFENERAVHSLNLHLTAVERFEAQEKAEKVAKHMQGFVLLVNHQKKEGTISEEAYNKLMSATVSLIEKWE